ncbi:MAG: NYN domain-containing protein [Pirellulales bacterium]
MSLIIDGYNLLNATTIAGTGPNRGTLANARLALLDFVVEVVPANQLSRTTVVFDAGKNAPVGRARRHDYRGLIVHFSTGYESADELIEELIAKNSAPRSLTVVSSDHRLQRAARRRRASPIDSERWYVEMTRLDRSQTEADTRNAKPPPPTTAIEIDFWTRLFTDD